MTRAPDVSVILPTYREAENLPIIIPEIASGLARLGIAGEIIVVDDDSPDDTGEVARRLSARYPVRVLVRMGERGLATAVMAGFRASAAKVVVVMDADGSHSPEHLPAMVAPILGGEVDLTVGSRWVPGGGVEHWPWHRQFISRCAAQLSLGLTRLRDPTTGFMALRRDLLAGVTLNPVGWKIVLEVVVKMGEVRLREIPITFADRERGQSKMSLREQWNYLRHIVRLHGHVHPTWLELLRFCVVGLLGVFVDLATVALLKKAFALDTRLCAVGGFAVAVTSNYVLNRLWTFSAGRSTSLARYPVFVAVCLLGLLVRLGVIHLLIEYAGWDGPPWYLVTNLLGIAAATAVNFTGARHIVFSPRSRAAS